MRNNLTKMTQAAILGIAMAFTISCSSDDGDVGNDPSNGGISSPSGGGSSCVQETIQIGNQVWQKCNLNVETNVGKYKCYNDDTANCNKYGKLYDWEAAKSACPSGFHLPTTGDWNILVNYAGGESVAGEKLKAKNGWPGNGNGTDVLNFSALPGGGGRSDGTFTSGGDLGIWWSDTECNDSRACALVIGYNADVLGDSGDKASLFSVRCVHN